MVYLLSISVLLFQTFVKTLISKKTSTKKRLSRIQKPILLENGKERCFLFSKQFIAEACSLLFLSYCCTHSSESFGSVLQTLSEKTTHLTKYQNDAVENMRTTFS